MKCLLTVLLLFPILSFADSNLKTAASYMINENYSESIKYFEKAFLNNEKDAEYWLGVSYLEGWGVDKNPTTAAAFFKLSTFSGNLDSALYLANMYLLGDPFPKNCERSESWIKLVGQGRIPEAWISIIKDCPHEGINK